MHPEDKIDHLFIPSLRLAFLTDNRWHPVQLPGVQAVRCTRFLDREHMAGFRARLRFNERAAAELLEQAVALMAQAKSCHDELETYYRAAVDFRRNREGDRQWPEYVVKAMLYKKRGNVHGNPQPFRLPIRQLVEFLLRTGSIDSRFTGFDRANEGARIHRRLQKAAGEGLRCRGLSLRSAR